MDVPYIDLPAQHRPLKDELLDAVETVLEHGWFVLGEEVTRFERRIADYLGVSDVIGVGSGTDAIELALRVRGIGDGDEVITVSHTFVSGVSAIAMTGATPVFVDVDPETMLMDPASLEEALTERTAAVMPVHLNGFSCDLAPIRQLCQTHDLALIEDCAQALGTRYDGEPVGTTDIGCFSLHPLKVLSACGDGGLIAVDDEDDAERLRQLRNNGRQSRDVFPSVSDNSRLDTLQAAILLVKLDHLDDWIARRREHAAAYRDALADHVRLPPVEGAGDRAIYSMFVIRHPRRDRLQERLADRGIETKVHYPFGVHQQDPFSDFPGGDLPATESVVSTILSLPVYPEMTDEQRGFVIEAVRDVTEELDR